MNRRTLNLLIVAAAIVVLTTLLMFAAALAEQQAQSIEERMVGDTDAVLGVLRTWHNQISQDQAIIKGQAERLSAVEKVTPGEPGQALRWKDTKWEWVTPPPPADKPVEAPGR